MNASKASEWIAGLDGKLVYTISDRSKLVGNAGFGFDVFADRAAITAAYAGAADTPFVSRGADPSRWLSRGGIGFLMNGSGAVQMMARYDIEIRGDFKSQSATFHLMTPL